MLGFGYKDKLRHSLLAALSHSWVTPADGGGGSHMVAPRGCQHVRDQIHGGREHKPKVLLMFKCWLETHSCTWVHELNQRQGKKWWSENFTRLLFENKGLIRKQWALQFALVTAHSFCSSLQMILLQCFYKQTRFYGAHLFLSGSVSQVMHACSHPLMKTRQHVEIQKQNLARKGLQVPFPPLKLRNWREQAEDLIEMNQMCEKINLCTNLQLTVDDRISESARIKWWASHLLRYLEFIILLTIVLVWFRRQTWMSPSWISLNLGPEGLPDLVLEGIVDWLPEAGEAGGLAAGEPGPCEEGVEFPELSLAVAMLVQIYFFNSPA